MGKGESGRREDERAERARDGRWAGRRRREATSRASSLSAGGRRRAMREKTRACRDTYVKQEEARAGEADAEAAVLQSADGRVVGAREQVAAGHVHG